MNAETFKAGITRLPNGCWERQVYRRSNGYTQYGRARQYAHRVSYELFKGNIPEGFEIDHLCRNRACVNPKHLEAVTHKENCRRTRSEYCKRGHLIGSDTYIRPDGYRECRQCRKEYAREYRSRCGYR